MSTPNASSRSDGGIKDLINHHFQLAHDQGINQFGLISIITLKNY
jgi:hypothetical protein